MYTHYVSECLQIDLILIQENSIERRLYLKMVSSIKKRLRKKIKTDIGGKETSFLRRGFERYRKSCILENIRSPPLFAFQEKEKICNRNVKRENFTASTSTTEWLIFYKTGVDGFTLACIHFYTFRTFIARCTATRLILLKCLSCLRAKNSPGTSNSASLTSQTMNMRKKSSNS